MKRIVVTHTRVWEAEVPDIQSAEELDAFIDLLMADAGPDADDVSIEEVG